MTLSDDFVTEAYQQESSEAFLILLTIDHDDLANPIRVVNNTENITSNGNVFIGFPFGLELPSSHDDKAPRAQLIIDNTSSEIATAIRLIASSPTVLIELIIASAPDVIERTFSPFNLRNVKWDVNQMSGDLELEFLDSEPYPFGLFIPSYFPGLFY